MQKFIIPFLIFASFMVFFALPNSLNICIPDGCNFAGNACNDNACVNESVSQHLNERSQFLNITVNLKLLVVLVVFLILFFVVETFSENEKSVIAEFRTKQKLFNLSFVKLFNYLVRAFSDGILNPKIY